MTKDLNKELKNHVFFKSSLTQSLTLQISQQWLSICIFLSDNPLLLAQVWLNHWFDKFWRFLHWFVSFAEIWPHSWRGNHFQRTRFKRFRFCNVCQQFRCWQSTGTAACIRRRRKKNRGTYFANFRVWNKSNAYFSICKFNGKIHR